MTGSKPSTALQMMQRIKDSMKHGEKEFSLISSPEAVYEADLTRVRDLLDEAIQKIRGSVDGVDSIRNEIISYASQLKVIESDRKTILSNAATVYQSQVSILAQNLSDMLVTAMGPNLVKRALTTMATLNSQDRPSSLTYRNDNASTGACHVLSTPPTRFTDDSGLDDHLTEQNRRLEGHLNHGPQGSGHEEVALAKRQKVSRSSDGKSDQGGSNGIQNCQAPNQTSHAESSSAILQIHVDQRPKARVVVLVRRSPIASKSDVPVNVHVVDVKGDLIGVIETVNPLNQHIQAILRAAALREVKIRRGLNFTNDYLAHICNGSEPKGVKILACMIQAAGNYMVKRCENCRGNRGPFEDCIKLSNASVYRCGNCEWGHQMCRGASMVSDAQHLEGTSQNTSSSTADAFPDDPQSWQVCQVKTRLFASDNSMDNSIRQYLVWVDSEHYFRYRILIASEPENKWGQVSEPVDFDIQLKEVAEVKWNIQACLVHVKMKQDCPTISKVDQQPRGDIVVAFAGPKTALGFLGFCVKWNIRVVREEPEKVVDVWQHMQPRKILCQNSPFAIYNVLDS